MNKSVHRFFFFLLINIELRVYFYMNLKEKKYLIKILRRKQFVTDSNCHLGFQKYSYEYFDESIYSQTELF